MTMGNSASAGAVQHMVAQAEHAAMLVTLVQGIHNLSIAGGGLGIKRGLYLTPHAVQQLASGNEYARGWLSCVAELVALLAQTAEGRKALADFGFEPIAGVS